MNALSSQSMMLGSSASRRQRALSATVSQNAGVRPFVVQASGSVVAGSNVESTYGGRGAETRDGALEAEHVDHDDRAAAVAQIGVAVGDVDVLAGRIHGDAAREIELRRLGIGAFVVEVPVAAGDESRQGEEAVAHQSRSWSINVGGRLPETVQVV